VDGLELIRTLRRRGDETRIIAMSSQAGPEGYLHAARLFGADIAVVKPRNPRRLVTIVQDALRSPV
jgi:DNA-binding response OmpR family regulator